MYNQRITEYNIQDIHNQDNGARDTKREIVSNHFISALGKASWSSDFVHPQVWLLTESDSTRSITMAIVRKFVCPGNQMKSLRDRQSQTRKRRWPEAPGSFFFFFWYRFHRSKTTATFKGYLLQARGLEITEKIIIVIVIKW